MHEQRTAIEEPPWNSGGGVGLNQLLFARNLTLNVDAAQNYKYMFGPHKGPLPHLKYHSERI